ncbi:putative transporter, permease protein, partial [Fulvimarina pelagi HTCC2506]
MISIASALVMLARGVPFLRIQSTESAEDLASKGGARSSECDPIVALSGLLVIITLICLTSAFPVVPIATAIAIFFVEPHILPVLAGPLLGEPVELRRLAAVGIGLVGALIF